MRIATADGRPVSDLTARARIRDAAIECFAAEGFDVSVRSIAQSAAVSPGLITHHFGSKASLRAECDAEVLRRYRELKLDSLANPSASLVSILASPAIAAPLVVYLLRAVHAGGRPARDFLTHLVDSVREVMAQSVATGLIRPSRDEEARLRYLTFQALGALLIEFLTLDHATPEEFVAAAMGGQREQILPTLELYTEGILTSRQVLDDYLDYLEEA